MTVWIGRRIKVDAPDLEKGYRWKWSAGHGGDEYGNCSFYVQIPLLPHVVIFYGRHYQTDVEVPEPGECEWVDRVIYGMSAEEHAAVKAGKPWPASA